MIHNFEVMLRQLVEGLAGHLSQWDGWAVLIAAALLGFRRFHPWSILLVGLIIDPAPYGLVAALIHGRHPELAGAAFFVAVQLVLAAAAYLAGRMAARFR